MLSNKVYKTNNYRLLQEMSINPSSDDSSSDETIKEYNP